jgi:hypothetical protein
MKRDAMFKQAGHTWIVISGGRLLPASLRQPLASKRLYSPVAPAHPPRSLIAGIV